MQDTYSGCEFEVFLSFCGGDTRKHFTDFLYLSLVKAGIRAFKDDVDLQKGENIHQLLQAIEQSKLSIPIFSKNYASREWCLHELAKMVECIKTRRQKILPIFFDVKPSVVRQQTDSYEEALFKHEERSGKEITQKWKEALKAIGSLSGWVLDECFDGHQGKLVDDVVSTVWKELKKHKLLVPDHVFGIDDMERKVMELVNIDADGIRIIGICGRPGSGKTILSKIIYNRISDQFERCSFLANVREKSQRHGLEHLQKQLITDILDGNCPDRIHNIDDGIKIISERFRTKKVLILLDDMDQKEHFEALARRPEWFGIGSRIILTTRNKDILEVPEVCGFFEVMNPQQSFEQLLLIEIEDSGFYKNTDDILESVRQREVSKIGVYGLGGVGKTTLALNVHDRLKFQSTSDKVFWVSVSHDCSIYNLQYKISRAVEVDLSEEDDQILRAAKLSAALKIRKFTLFLDDVWSYIPLEKVGIPDKMEGFKLILTTRSLEVCRRMGCNRYFRVDPLLEFEAWNLFKKKLGHETQLSSEINQVAQLITKECGGLPLAIITIASSMRGVDDIHEWRNALQILKGAKEGQDSMDSEVFPVLKLSYDRLKDKQVQQCLLHCAVYPEDQEIEREWLIHLFIDLGLINELNRQAEFDRGHTILNKLEYVCLLEMSPTSKRCVKLHDLIRDMALRMSKSTFMVKCGQSLQEPPGAEEWTCDLELVSLMSNRLKEISLSPKCPKLSTLLLNRNYNFLRIRNRFFKYSSPLKVLDLSYTNIEELPDSVANLVSLTALIVSYCTSLKRVPSLRRLSSLKKLDLAFTAIRKVPDGMQNMAGLRYLDLRCMHLKKLPIGLLKKLSSIQHFEIIWPQGDMEVLKKGELGCLKKLEIFKVQFRGWYEYKEFVKSKITLNRYYATLEVGISPRTVSVNAFAPYGVDKFVEIYSYFPSEEDFLLLPEDVQSIILRNNCFRGSLSELLSRNSVANLEYCQLYNNPMECLFLSLPTHSAKDRQPMAPQIQPAETFSNLRCLVIKRNQGIKKLFEPCLTLNLQNLEELEVSSCYQLQEIIADEEEEEQDQEARGEIISSYQGNEIIADDEVTEISTAGKNDHTITFPKLRHLRMRFLPELKKISKSMLVCDSIQEVEIARCLQLKRIPLSIKFINGELSPPSSLKHITVSDESFADARSWWESLEWDIPAVKDALQPFVRLRLCDYASSNPTRDFVSSLN